MSIFLKEQEFVSAVYMRVQVGGGSFDWVAKRLGRTGEVWPLYMFSARFARFFNVNL